jgi:hypothetical protein
MPSRRAAPTTPHPSRFSRADPEALAFSAFTGVACGAGAELAGAMSRGLWLRTGAGAAVVARVVGAWVRRTCVGDGVGFGVGDGVGLAVAVGFGVGDGVGLTGGREMIGAGEAEGEGVTVSAAATPGIASTAAATARTSAATRCAGTIC